MNARAKKIWDDYFGAGMNKAVDAYGVWIAKAAYGKDTRYGWGIDHIRPKSRGGSNRLSNQRPLNIRDTRERSS